MTDHLLWLVVFYFWEMLQSNLRFPLLFHSFPLQQSSVGNFIKSFLEITVCTVYCSSIIYDFGHLSKTTNSGNTVDLPSRNPNCLLLNSLFLFMWFMVLSLTNDSMTLHNIHVRLTGLWLFGLFLSPFFKIPMTFICFHSSGMFLFVNVLWYKICSGLSSAFDNSLRVFGCRLSGPDDFVEFSFDSFFLTSSFQELVLKFSWRAHLNLSRGQGWPVQKLALIFSWRFDLNSINFILINIIN